MTQKTLKRDLFGEICLISSDSEPAILRDSSAAAWPLRWFARLLLRREAAALTMLDGLPGVPQVIAVSHNRVVRSYCDGAPLYEAKTTDPDFYREAMRLVRRLHARGVVHNDLAKEPNILVTPAGLPVFIDFQIALFPRRRHRLFRVLAREDIRHVLKHKRNYCPDHLTEREKSILRDPSLLARLNRRIYKPVYLFITRRLLGWADREGAGDLRT